MNMITAKTWEIEARQHVIFGELNNGFINKAKHTAWEFVSIAVNIVEQKWTAVLTTALDAYA